MSSDPSKTDITRQLVRTMYESSLAGDTERFMGCLDQNNLVVLEPSFLPYGGRIEGIAGFQALFAKVAQYIDLTSIKLDSVVADGDVGVAFIRAQSVNHDSEIQIAERSVVRDGKIVEMRVYFHELGSMTKVIKR